MGEEASRFGDYLLLKRLPGGGAIESYLAKQQSNHRAVVIRRVEAASLPDAEAKVAFFAEAEQRARLNHLNVARIYDTGEDEGYCYICAEYVDGTTLRKVLRRLQGFREKLPPALAVQIMIKVCDGLGHAALATPPVIHRDFGPHAVLLADRGDVKVSDFGSEATSTGPATSAGTVMRQFVYQAPERMQKKPTDARANVFSAGVVLYELLTGQNPFARSSPIESLEAIASFQAPPLKDGGAGFAELDPILARSMIKAPDKRYAHCGEMSKELARVANRGRLEGGDVPLGTYVSRISRGTAGDTGWFTDSNVETGMSESPIQSGVTHEMGATQEVAGTGRGTGTDEVDGPESTVIYDPSAQVLEGAPKPNRWPAAYVATWLLMALATVGIGRAVMGGSAAAAVTVSENGVAPPATAPGGTQFVPIPPEEVAAPAPRRIAAPPQAAPPAAPAPQSAGAVPVVPEAAVLQPAPGVRPAAAEPRDPVPPVPSSPPATAEPRKATAKAKRRAKAAPPLAPKHGSIQVITQPAMPVFLYGKRVRGRVILEDQVGRLTIGTGKTPFVLKVRYDARGGNISYRLDSQPWAMVQDHKGIAVGRTPTQAFGAARSENLRIVNPVEGKEARLTLRYKP